MLGPKNENHKPNIAKNEIYFVFISVLKFLDFNLELKHGFSHACFSLPNFLGQVMHFWTLT
jgi:hypothetical protein